MAKINLRLPPAYPHNSTMDFSSSGGSGSGSGGGGGGGAGIVTASAAGAKHGDAVVFVTEAMNVATATVETTSADYYSDSYAHFVR